MSKDMYDVIIIGAGIVGCMLARTLSRYRLKTAVLERENDLANETTMANSAIVHTGYDPEEGTLKARLNVLGARMYPELCRTLDCAYRQTGAFVAACGSEERKHLELLKKRADARGIEARFVPIDEARQQEPALSDQVSDVLSFPQTAVIYPWQVALACMETAAANGTELYLNTPCQKIERLESENGWRIFTPQGSFDTRLIVNAAGLGAHEVCSMVMEPDFEMTPRKGEYYVLDQDAPIVSTIIFPVPGPKGKGVLAVPTVYGNTLIGPDAQSVEGQDLSTSFKGLDDVRAQIARTVQKVPFEKTIRTFAGVRPSTTAGDFILKEPEEAPGFILAAGIDSPGLASAPAIAEYLVEELIAPHLELHLNPQAVSGRKAPAALSSLPAEKRNALIEHNPLYGRIICRCEQISEGEIVDCIHGPCGARTVKGVKKRVRPGMGRCQGGFCEPRVVEILARELGCSPLEICHDSLDSAILKEEIR